MKIYWSGDSKNIIGAKVRALRLEKKWSQHDLATKVQLLGCECSDLTILRIEKGDRFVPDYFIRSERQQCRIPQTVCRRATVTRASRSKARLRPVATRRDSWRSHVHRTRFRRPRSSSSYNPAMSGVEGDSPRLSLGDSKGVFSSEREYPLWCRGAHAAPPPALARENQDTPLEKGVKKTRHIAWVLIRQ